MDGPGKERKGKGRRWLDGRGMRCGHWGKIRRNDGHERENRLDLIWELLTQEARMELEKP